MTHEPEPDEWLVPMQELSASNSSPDNQRTRRRRVMVAAAAILVATAAASIAIRIEDASHVATNATATRGSSTTEQFATIVREHSVPIQAWIDSEESCDHVECALPIYAYERYAALSPLLNAFNHALAELESPPDEIAALVATTKAQVDAAAHRVALMVLCGPPSPDSPDFCGDEQSEAEAAYKRLPAVFAAWDPYTGAL